MGSSNFPSITGGVANFGTVTGLAFSGGSTTAPLAAGEAGANEEAGVGVVLLLGDSAGEAAVVVVADAGTGVEDATGAGEEDAGGALTLTDCGLPACTWAKVVSVKKLRTLRINNPFFISNSIRGFSASTSARVRGLNYFQLAGLGLVGQGDI